MARTWEIGERTFVKRLRRMGPEERLRFFVKYLGELAKLRDQGQDWERFKTSRLKRAERYKG